MQSTALVLFPGALGDFLCFLPTLLALQARHKALTLIANPVLYGWLDIPHLRFVSMHRRELANLFATGDVSPELHELLRGHAHTYTWSGWGTPGVAERLAAVCGGRVHSFPFRGMDDGEHAVEYYARCLGLTPAPVNPNVLREDAEWLIALRRRHGFDKQPYLVVHAGSGSVAKNWTGFAALVDDWQQRRSEKVIVVRGPAEVERGTVLPRSLTVESPALSQLTTLLRHAALFLGNDSGVSHLAAAAGAVGVVLFGPSNPHIWAPHGNLQILHAPVPCPQCGNDVLCTHRLPVEMVAQALERVSPTSGRG